MSDDDADHAGPAGRAGLDARLLEVADELYGLALADFTPARDARAKQLKGDDAALSSAVKKLKKPSLAAWVVDLLVRRDQAQVTQVLELGAALRQAAEQMSGDDLRALTRQRRQLTAAVTTGARRLAAQEGVRVTEAVADQVEATLTAAMLDAACAQAVRSGLLVAALTPGGPGDADAAAAVAVPEALGFEASAREPEPPPRPELHVVPDPDADEKALAAAREALDEAEGGVEEARGELSEAQEAVERLEARSLELQASIDEVRRRLAALEEEAEEVEDETEDAEDAQTAALHALAEAQSARDDAAAALTALEKRLRTARR